MSELKVHLGCGGNRIPGWQNFDRDVDLTALPLPWKENEVDTFFIEHACEHIHQAIALRLFENIHYCLKPGGSFKLCIPVSDRIEDRAHLRDLITGNGHEWLPHSHGVIDMLECAGFSRNQQMVFDKSICGHWKVIGEDKDRLETFRVEAFK